MKGGGKGSNLATIILVATITTIIAAIVVNSFLGDPNEESVTIKYMDVVAAEVEQPDREVFNDRAVNPTVEVYVGNCPAGEVWDENQQTCMEDENSGEEAGTDEAGE